MPEPKFKPYPKHLKALMAEKSRHLSKAAALEEMGLSETAHPVWQHAAGCEERIAPLMEVLGRELEAALHRVSAATCYEKCGNSSRAANLYRAALGGPLQPETREDVTRKLAKCLVHVRAASLEPVA